MRETWLPTTRRARYFVLGSDEADAAEGNGPPPGPAAEVWFVLHGYRQQAGRFLRYFADLDDGKRLLVAPEALSRFYVDPAEGRHGEEHRVGASWMTREGREREIEDYVEWLDRVAAEVGSRAGGEAPRVVLGFSQGGHTAVRWAVLGRTAPQDLVLWGSYLPGDLDPDRVRDRLAGCRITLVRGTEDVHRDPDRARSEASRLRDWDLDARVVEYPGGHRIDREALAGVARAIRHER